MRGPALTAWRAGEEAFRLDRLQRVVGHIREKCPCALEAIAELDDYKGTLTVTWRPAYPAPAMIRAVHRAWEAEAEQAVEHEYMP